MDPRDIELIKSSLGIPTWFDSDDFKDHFQLAMGELHDDAPDEVHPLNHKVPLQYYEWANSSQASWEDLSNGLDPLDVELIKSSLRIPTWF